jgi:hypothetical protein
MSKNKFGDLYTSGKQGEEVISLYNLEQLVLDSALVRVNKVSENGVSLTVGLRLDSDFESKVSKNAKEKGTQPIKLEKGEILVFQVNSSVKDDRKPDEVNGRCQTLINAFTGKAKKGDETITLHSEPIQDGDFIRLTFDGEQVPIKGLINLKSLKAYLDDSEDSIIFIDRNLTVDGYDFEESDQAVYDAIKDTKVPTQGNYAPKKSFKDMFDERLALVDSIMQDPKGDVILRIGKYMNESVSWNEDPNGTSYWYAEGETLARWISSILSV